jgi:hypothetical protein
MGTRIGDNRPPGELPRIDPAPASPSPTAAPPPAPVPELGPALAAVSALVASPLPPPSADAVSPEGAAAIMALEPMLGVPSGEPVGEAFAHPWISALARGDA